MLVVNIEGFGKDTYFTSIEPRFTFVVGVAHWATVTTAQAELATISVTTAVVSASTR